MGLSPVPLQSSNVLAAFQVVYVPMMHGWIDSYAWMARVMLNKLMQATNLHTKATKPSTGSPGR